MPGGMPLRFDQGSSRVLGRAAMPVTNAKPEADGYTKVMLSIASDQLRKIDERADAAHMTRSAYVVEMTLRDEVGLMSTIATLREELRRFSTDNVGWKGEMTAMRKQVDKLGKANDAARLAANAALTEIEQRNKAGETVSSLATIKALRAIVQALG
jgi:hypothetical protein